MTEDQMKNAVAEGIREGMRDAVEKIGDAVAEATRRDLGSEGDPDSGMDESVSAEFMDILQRIELLLQFVADNTSVQSEGL